MIVDQNMIPVSIELINGAMLAEYPDGWGWLYDYEVSGVQDSAMDLEVADGWRGYE